MLFLADRKALVKARPKPCTFHLPILVLHYQERDPLGALLFCPRVRLAIENVEAAMS